MLNPSWPGFQTATTISFPVGGRHSKTGEVLTSASRDHLELRFEPGEKRPIIQSGRDPQRHLDVPKSGTKVANAKKPKNHPLEAPVVARAWPRGGE